MNRIICVAGVLFCVWLGGHGLLTAQQQASQPQPQQQEPASKNPEIEALRRQIQALAAGQIAIQTQLDEIRSILLRTPAPAAAPPPGAVAMVDSLIETSGAPTKGAATAKVTIVEFSDYECPFCGRYVRETLPGLTRDYIDSGKARYVFRNFPLESIHKNAFKAAVAAECAGEQGKYWPMHDQLFASQSALDPQSLVAHGKTTGLDVAQYQQCLNSDKPGPRIRQDQTEGQRAGASSTPTFFVALTMPGDSKVRAVRIIRGAQPYPVFKSAIDSVLASAK